MEEKRTETILTSKAQKYRYPLKLLANSPKSLFYANNNPCSNTPEKGNNLPTNTTKNQLMP